MDEINTTLAYHIPALLQESIDGLNIDPDGVYVDVTFGGGGHARAILERLSPKGRLLGFDQDEDAERNIPDDPRFIFVRSNFRYLVNFLDWHGITQIDGLLADLGVSFHHFDDESRGFSFRYNAPLDMRMNKRHGKTAADLLNTLSEKEIAEIFYRYGELKNTRRIASEIIKYRVDKKIKTTEEFLEILKPFSGKEKEKKFLAQVFQALRMEVNAETNVLRELLFQATGALKTDGRLVVITYHSLEDRLVKNFFRTGNFEGKAEQDFYGNLVAPLKPVNNKVIVPAPEEIAHNSRARSAKLRIAQKIV